MGTHISKEKYSSQPSKRAFLYFSLGIQLLMSILIGLDYASIHLPLIRQVVGLGYLGFLPGYVILKSFRFSGSSAIRTSLYSIGLSIAFVMIIGALLSIVVPQTEGKPGALLYFYFLSSIILVGLTFLIYFRTKEGPQPPQTPVLRKEKLSSFFKPMSLYLLFIPIFSICGTLIMREYSTNIVMLFVYIMIGFAIILSLFRKIFPVHLYPLALFCIAIALLYQDTLSSVYLNGWD